MQFATDCAAQVIVGVDVVTAGSDMAQLAPMVQQVQQRLGRAPDQWLVDGGFPAHEQIDAVAGKTEVYAPAQRAPARNSEGARAPNFREGVATDAGLSEHQRKTARRESSMQRLQ